ncbi:MAG TPA: insulinase family protein [Rhizomicrobium sp.]|jgi:zinc protease|nr:insulinase family protein [Rhizomicrobium sp.]
MNARKFLAGIVLACAVAVPSLAQAVNIQTLSVGRQSEVWFVQDRTVPMIAMTVALPAGSAYDPANKAGLATFAAALIDEGAGPYNSQGFQAALSGRAIRLNATAERDYLVISLVTLKENAPAAFRLLGIALSKPHFDADAIARVRAQILAGLQQEDEDPSNVAAKAFYRTFFGNHPYGHSVSGDAGSVASITREDLKAFAAQHWVRGGIHIAVSGDVDVATLKSLLGAAFSQIPDRAPPPEPFVTHMGQPGVQIIPMPVPQPNIVFGMPGILRNDKDFLPAYVANYILGGGGFSSRLTTEVREKRGLTYDISTGLNTFHRAGMVAGQVATKAGSVQQTIAVIKSTIDDFVTNGPTDKELTDAKTYLTGSFPLAFSSNTGIAGQLNTFQNAGLPVSYVAKRNDLINAVTADDVRRAAKRIFNSGKLTIVVAGSPQAAQRSKPLPGAEKPTKPAPQPTVAAKKTPAASPKAAATKSVVAPSPSAPKTTPHH